MAVRIFLMGQDLTKLQIIWSIDPHFMPFKNLKELYQNNECDRLHNILPERIFADVMLMLVKHFFKQWYSAKIESFSIASTPPIAASLVLFLLDTSISNTAARSEFHGHITRLPS